MKEVEEIKPDLKNEDKLKEEQPKEKQSNAIAIDMKTQTLAVKDSSELMRQIKIFMEGCAFPKTMNTPAKCITAWNLAASFKTVSPQRAMSRMMYINDQLSIWGELPKALAENTGELEDFKLYTVDKDYLKICEANKNLSADPYAAICKIKRKGRTENEYFFTIDEAEKAGLLAKKGPWQTYAKTMLCWKAQGAALKFEFGDALMGAEIAEYSFTNEFAKETIKDVTPIPDSIDKASVLNQKFKIPPQAVAPSDTQQ